MRAVRPTCAWQAGLGLVVGLRLHDHAARLAVRQRAADELLRHLHHRAGVEGRREGHYAGWPSSSARAWASCSRTRASAVPPSDTFDSSHERWDSTS